MEEQHSVRLRIRTDVDVEPGNIVQCAPVLMDRHGLMHDLTWPPLAPVRQRFAIALETVRAGRMGMFMVQVHDDELMPA